MAGKPNPQRSYVEAKSLRALMERFDGHAAAAAEAIGMSAQGLREILRRGQATPSYERAAELFLELDKIKARAACDPKQYDLMVVRFPRSEREHMQRILKAFNAQFVHFVEPS